jgi:hypothetical protein
MTKHRIYVWHVMRTLPVTLRSHSKRASQVNPVEELKHQVIDNREAEERFCLNNDPVPDGSGPGFYDLHLR